MIDPVAAALQVLEYRVFAKQFMVMRTLCCTACNWGDCVPVEGVEGKNFKVD
jgi:hypothetical protein